MDTTKSDDFVNVAIRIRPMGQEDDASRSCIYHLSSDPPVIQVADRSFSFDNIFSGDSEQVTIYNETVAPLVEHVIKGYNSTVFAYGQTGTGKTYTMGTDPERYIQHTGLISRTLFDIFNRNDENNEISVEISFYEIYNEKVYDLLGEMKKTLTLKGFNVQGLSTHRVESLEDAEKLLIEGGNHRHTGETKQNGSSSRSHAIFSIHCCIKTSNGDIKSKLNLVDLAGSESVKKTGNEGNQLFEGININKGLLSIGQVINALSNNRNFVPYRQSTITTILKDSLNKKNFVNFIACVSQKIDDLHETLQTLDFAQRAKRLKHKPEMNTPRVADYLLAKQKHLSRGLHTLASRRLPFKTPVKSASLSLLPPIHSTMTTDMDHGDGHTTLDSLSTISEMPVSISPIVKRCINAVETSILEKIENIIQKSILMTPIKPNTPKLNQHDLRNQVTKIVRKEIQLSQTFRNRSGSINSNVDNQTIERETCTPSGLVEFPDASPIEIAKDKPHWENGEDSMSLFKVPKVAAPRKHNRLTTSSPILDKPVRRSVRLSVKSTSTYSDSMRRRTTNRIEEVQPVVRRSMRLSVKPHSPYTDGTRRRSVKLQGVPVPKPRLLLKQISPTKATPIPTPRKRNSLSSKCSHNIKILEILNTGGVSDLVKLNSIGPKTATMIIHFREREGSFKKIYDLERMPWRGKGYDRFLKENFIEM